MISQIIRHTFKRNFKNNRFHGLLNILGLSVGLASFMLIILFVQQQKNYDAFHTHYEQIYRLIFDRDSDSWSGTPAQLGPLLKEKIPEIRNYVRMEEAGDVVVLYEEDRYYEKNLLYADNSFFRVFSFPLLKGQKQPLLQAKNDIVLSQETARKIFGDADPIGQTLQLFEKGKQFTVTAVVEDAPSNSSIDYSMIIPFPILAEKASWGQRNFTTFLWLDQEAPFTRTQQKITEVAQKRSDDDVSLENLAMQPMKEMRFEPIRGNAFDTLDRKYIYLLISAAFFLLFLAAINYTNLTSAISIKRSKEVALKKVAGSSKRRIISEMIGESVLMAILAFLLAILLVEWLRPMINQSFQWALQIHYGHLPWFLIIAVITGILGGIYPAVYCSKFRIMGLLKENVYRGQKAGRFRNALVLIQFGITSFLLIVALTYHKQMDYLTNQDIGMNPEGVYRLQVHWAGVKVAELKNTLEKDARIAEVTTTTYQAGMDQWHQSVRWEGMSEDQRQSMFIQAVDQDFFGTLQIDLEEGKQQMGKYKRKDKNLYVINESARQTIGWSKATGKEFTIFGPGNDGEVVGVAGDFNARSLHHRVDPTVFLISQDALPYNMLIRFNDPVSGNSIDVVRKYWNNFAPENAPFMFSSMEENFGQLYQTERFSKKVAIAFTTVALIISLLGLLGLATYISLQRTKEIGVRKVLGSTGQGILKMLVGNFLRWVLIAFIIACPLAWIYLEHWLQNFAYHTELSAWIFLTAGVFVTGVAVFSVIFQASRAARSNPVDSLRYE